MRVPRREILTLFVLLASLGFFQAADTVAAQGPSPGWTISLVAQPANLADSLHNPGEFEDQYVVVLTNTGAAPTSGPITITDGLPAGVSVGASLNGAGWEPCNASQAGAVVTCTYGGVIAPLERSPVLTIPVAVTAPPLSQVMNTVTVAGGGAPVATATSTTQVAGPNPFRFTGFALQTENSSGAPDIQAGDHPFDLTASLDFPQQATPESNGRTESPVAIPKALEVELPAGIVGNPQAAPRCTIAAFVALACPRGARVGTAFVDLAQGLFIGEESYAIYNMVPERGYPAEFGVYASAIEKFVLLYATVGPAPDYRLRVVVPDVPEAAKLGHFTATFFGDPGLVDSSPGEEFTAAIPFLTNPSDCSAAAPSTNVKAHVWEEPDAAPVEDEAQSAPVAGCNHLQFGPGLSFTPETTRADEPSGYTFDLNVPQSQSTGRQGLATPPVKDVKVTLPPGVSINPSAADGLGACPATGPEGFNMEGPESEAPNSIGSLAPVSGHCPLDSQIGTVEAETPLLPPHALTGHLYIVEPQCGGEGQAPCTNTDAQDGKLFSLDLQLEGEGVFVKLHGSVAANPKDGRLTATFDNNPQLPVSDITLHITGGPRAPLANPPTCGEATTTSGITPWSAPETPDAFPVSAFTVTGCEGYPFNPGFQAGTTATNAGAYTDFIATFTRPDRQQNLDAIQVTTPPGLLGMLSHVALCGEPQAAQGICPESSRIGTATAGAGAGSHPYWVSGPVFLTGPYRGAPFGLSIAIPAKAGPFNLGTVVVRSAITIDPVTSALTVTSDPLPQILDGVPLRVQSVNVTVDKPAFMFNPTNCTGKQVTGTLASAQGAVSHVASPFAAGGCKNLPFKPKFTASTKAKTSKANGASLTVKVASTAGQANIAKVDVQLPKALPARLTTLQKACTEAQFAANPAGCPAGSVIGVAKAVTPVLNVPLVGPAILVSHGGAAFPDVEFILQGQGVTVELDGKTLIKKGITYSRFETVPDAPITSFETVLPQGPHSVLAANLPAKAKGSLCGSKLVLPTTLVGQNGAQVKQSTKLGVSGCPRVEKVKKQAKAKLKKKRK